MKNAFYVGLIGCLALMFFGCGEETPEDRNKNAPPMKTEFKISTADFKAAIDTVEGAIFADVRTSREYQSGHIEGARNLNVLNGTFRSFIDTLDRNTPMIVYCQKGRRSGRAANALKKLGFTRIYDLEGGLDKWTAEGNAVE